jgi:hypothetical protein
LSEYVKAEIFIETKEDTLLAEKLMKVNPQMFYFQNKNLLIVSGLKFTEEFTKLDARNSPLFERLNNFHKVIPTSALFRWGLDDVLIGIIEKASPESVVKGRNILNNKQLGKIPLDKALEFSNMLVFDTKTQKTYHLKNLF